MKLIIAPVTEASVELMESQEIRKIWTGLLIYVWIWKQDVEKIHHKEFLEKVVHKITNCKLFHNEQTQKIDTSITENSGEILLISNFTLYGNCDKWTKIDFWDGARFDEAKPIYEMIISHLQEKWITVKTGEFGAKMQIKSTNLWPLNYLFEF